MKLSWHVLESEEVLKNFAVELAAGLSENEARERLNVFGSNLLEQKKRASPWKKFLFQFRDFMVLVLLGAAVFSAALGEHTDALTILAIVLLNALLGFLQEQKAERSLQALRDLAAPAARVLRNGVARTLGAAELVPGDIVLLEAGDRIPADIRLCRVSQLSVNEAPLTGESAPVLKQAEALPDTGCALGDQVNMAFMGTHVTGGHASGVVTGTGMQTEMGRVAHLLEAAGAETTPLQKRLAQLGRWLVAACAVVCAVVVFLGLARGFPVHKMLLAGISLAVAAIPEGLPAVVTIALAGGVQRMAKKKAIVRRLPAVEALGCATVICADKTGTLTQNMMNVREIWAGGNRYQVEGEGYSPQGRFMTGGRIIRPAPESDLAVALQAASLCNNAQLRRGDTVVRPLWRGERHEWRVDGDPTEGALLVAAARAGIWRGDLERRLRRIAEIPFDGSRRRMSVVYAGEQGKAVYVKGAPEVVIDRCAKILESGEVRKLDERTRARLFSETERMGALALRSLAVAYRPLQAREATGLPGDDHEWELVFAGLFGILDPPRPEVLPAIGKCQSAGIKTVMITGDHRTTAVAVARTLRILPSDGGVLTGRELDRLSDKELGRIVEKIHVYARVNPAHKLRIVRALKRRGHVVAMTGDGVNDAPAVKEADIGIAMGRSGTDVTREAASLVLADDNFATIVSAVEEGRGVYDNIRKFIRFLMACNTGEVLTMLFAMLAGLPLPLRPIQILWINLVTDGLPAIALGVERGEAGAMRRAPRPPREGIFARGLWQEVLWRGTLISLSSVAVFAWSLQQGMALAEAQTMVFTTLIVLQLLYVFDCRSEPGSGPEAPFYSNPSLVGAVLLSFGLLLAVLYHPGLAVVFGTVPLGTEHWAAVLTVSLFPAVIKAFAYLLCSLRGASGGETTEKRQKTALPH
jgi:Ca2+-transporting ATPase